MTYELAAAALLSILHSIRGSVVDTVFASLVVGVGLHLYWRYVTAYRDLPAENREGEARTMAWLTILPVAALLSALLSYAWWWIPEAVANYMLAVGVAWLIFSGTTQALFWYRNAWEGSEDDPSSDRR